MKIYRPTYVKDFKCNGKACASRCCRDWKISLDEATRQKFSALPDRADFFKHVDAPAQAFKMQSSGACPFLNENFLCKLQLKHGEDFLPAICQSFPRVTYKLSEEIFTQSMTLTCPVTEILILLRGEPITFEVVNNLSVRQIFNVTGKFSEPEKFLERQQAAIKILQRRDLSINQRLKNLCEFFGENISDLDVQNNAETLTEIFSEMYKANLSAEKKAHLAAIYRVNQENILAQLHENFSVVLENYLVNEFFMRLYPCAFKGDEKLNCRVFVRTYRAIEFAAVLTAISRARLTLEDFLELLCALSDKFNHSRRD